MSNSGSPSTSYQCIVPQHATIDSSVSPIVRSAISARCDPASEDDTYSAYLSPEYSPDIPGLEAYETTHEIPFTWGSWPQLVYCRHCNSEAVTRVKYVRGTCTWLSCFGCLCIGCYLGCCLLPFCVESFNDCSHFCSICGAFLGLKKVI